MKSTALLRDRVAAIFLSFALAISISGCTVQFVADYDAAAFEEILATARKVDRFYGALLESDPASRQYAKFADEYVSLESDIQGIVTRNQARALNSESTEIAKIILEKLRAYKNRHKTRDQYTDGNAKLDRDRFVRLFSAAASAEEAKKLAPEDMEAEEVSE
jgi:hypothetical protein